MLLIDTLTACGLFGSCRLCWSCQSSIHTFPRSVVLSVGRVLWQCWQSKQLLPNCLSPDSASIKNKIRVWAGANCGRLLHGNVQLLVAVLRLPASQEDTFDAVKTNVCHMIKQLAQHLRPQQLDLLFSKFENRKGRTLPDTLRLLDLLRRLALSDTKKVCCIILACFVGATKRGRLPNVF